MKKEKGKSGFPDIVDVLNKTGRSLAWSGYGLFKFIAALLNIAAIIFWGAFFVLNWLSEISSSISSWCIRVKKTGKVTVFEQDCAASQDPILQA